MLTRRQILAGGAVMAAGVVAPLTGARSQPVTCRVWTGRCWTPVATNSLRQGDLVQLAGQYPVVVTSEGWVRDPTTRAFVLMRHHYGRFVQDMYRGIGVTGSGSIYVQPGRTRGRYTELTVGSMRVKWDAGYRYWLSLGLLDWDRADDDTGIIDVPYTVKVA